VSLPKTTLMTSQFIMLPMNTSLTDDDVTYICDVIEQFHTKA
jgi:dTDP-4-amino-4,6-dideoxygalactose transaminase